MKRRKQTRCKYRRGRLVRSLNDLTRQGFVYFKYQKRPISRGWFLSWHIFYAERLIEQKCLRVAVPIQKGGKA